MRIGIDARLIRQTGVGRYIRNLLRELREIDTKNEYVVFVRSEDKALVEPGKRWRIETLNVHWHTLAEQLQMPITFLRAHLDVVHIPYFTIPLLYPGRMIVTIHDLTVLHVNTGKASTLPYPLYQLRRLGYTFILKYGLAKAEKILAVSQATKQDIITSCHTPEEKIIVTYEGIDPVFLSQPKIPSVHKPTKPFFLYVGNAYPHKNLETILLAFRKLKDNHGTLPYTLKCVGVSDYFYRRMQQSELVNSLGTAVEFTGPVADNQLLAYYDQAMALVFPSVMEGFGLPALEAVARGCPVLCSDIPVFHELLGSSVQYIQAKDTTAWANSIDAVGRNPRKSEMNSELSVRFNWRVMAELTLHTYERGNSVRSD